MKPNLFAAACAALLFTAVLTACGGNEKPARKADTAAKQAIDPDVNDITNTLHDFYTWYGDNADRIDNIPFVIEKNKHMILDEKQLTAYLGELKKSGFVSDELLANETKFYQACAKIWQTESSDEVTTGLEADRYYCAQDYVAPHNKAAIKATVTGDRAKAILTLMANDTLTFDMKKENKKWFIAKLGCNSGVTY